MAHQRNGYWYQSVREGQHVRTVYIGKDEWGLVAACDNERQQERAQERAKLQALAAQEGSGDKAVDAIVAQLKALTDNALTASGYHKHSGTWRKKRKVRK
jgi:cobalamin biosynthesis Mg chelatase CobN